MKKQNLNEDALFNMYGILGELLSLNHTCIRIANQDVPIFANKTVLSKEEIFSQNQTLKSVWLEKKLEDAAEMRNEIFSDILTAWDIHKTELFAGIDIAQTLKNKQTALVKAYNAYFGEKKSFKEIFNGFNTTDPRFQKIIREFDTNKCVYAEDEKLMSFKFFEDISAVAKNDVLDSGRPSMFFRKPGGDVSTISGEEIEEYIKDATSVLKSVNKEIQVQNKKLAPLYKKAHGNFNDYELHSKIGQIKSEIFNLLEKQKKAQRYKRFAEKLLERLVYTNTDYDSSKALRFFEGFLDLTTGINVFKKENQIEFNDVYIHSLERSYLTYLSNLFTQTSSLENQDESSKQQGK